MKTLLFCTAYASSPEVWESRYKTWFDYYTNGNLIHSHKVIFDDASPELPNFCPAENYYRFETHLGRLGHYDYPGWYRSFAYAARYAKDNGFTKIIHAESDAYLLSDYVICFVNGLKSGWHSLWCPRHNVNESALQIICEDQINSYLEFTKHPYDTYRGQYMDQILPYTHAHRHFVGDRYGEYLDKIPSNADFSAQTTPKLIKEYLATKK